MSEIWRAHLHDASVLSLELLVFRAAPGLVFTMVTDTATALGRVAALLSYASLVAVLYALDVPFERMTAGGLPILVFAGMTLMVYRLRQPVVSGALSRAGLFALCCLGFLLLPALLAPDHMLVPLLVIGWDLTMSGYSYVVDTSTGRQPMSLSDCMFFMLVNPTLVYAERGKRVDDPRFRPTALLRIAAGAACVMGYRLLPPLATSALRGLRVGSYGAWLSLYATRLSALALSHSGLASMQIGIMRLLGFWIPERYNFALLASSPREFWRRWNIWVGRWAQRYVFSPLALAFTRRSRRFRAASRGLAVLATFILIGVLHDVFRLLQALQSTERVVLRYTGIFILLGVTVVVWVGLERPLGRFVRRLRLIGPAGRAFSWAVFMHLLFVIMHLANPEASIRLPGLIDQ